MFGRQRSGGGFRRMQVRRGRRRQRAVGQSEKAAVFGRERRSPRVEEAVECVDRPPGDDGQRAAEPFLDRLEGGDQAGSQMNGVGMRSDVGQRAVEIQEQRARFEDGR